MRIDPALKTRLQIREIDDSHYRVEFIAGYKKIGHIIVTMKMLTLTAMFEKAMSTTELDSTHDGEWHFENLFANRRLLAKGDCWLIGSPRLRTYHVT